MSSELLPAELSLTPDRDQARRLLDEELAEPQYQEEFAGPLREWIDDLLSRLGGADIGIGGVSIPFWPILLTLLILGAIVLCVVLVRPRLQRSPAPGTQLEQDPATTAEQLRQRATEHLHSGRTEEAFRDRFRAVVRAAEERALIHVAHGTTAAEAAEQLAGVFPAHSAALRSAAGLFNLSAYGGGALHGTDYTRICELDDGLEGAAVDHSGSAGSSTAPEAAR